MLATFDNQRVFSDQAENTVHLLKQWESIVKISGVQLDESEDEEISVAYSAHLRTKDLVVLS